MVRDSKFFKMLRWIITRTGLVYLFFGLAICSTFDVKTIWGDAMVRSFNRLMPSFEAIIDHVVSGRKLTDEQWKGYIEYYKRVAALSEEDGAAFFFLGYCQTQIGKGKAAMRNFQFAIERVRGLFWFQYDLAVALYNKGNYAGAIYWFQKAVDFGPDRMREYMFDSKLYRQIVGRVYERGHDVDQALLYARRRSYLLIAKSWYQMHRYDNALNVVQYGLSEGFGQDRDLYLMAALSLKQLGKYSEAASILRSYLVSYPGDVNAIKELENLLILNGNREAAEEVKTIKDKVSKKFDLQSEDIFHKEAYKLL